MNKTQLLSKKTKEELHRHRKEYFLTYGIFFIGVLFGTVFLLLTKPDATLDNFFNTFLSSFSLQNVARREVFKLSFLYASQMAVIVWISGWNIWLLPLAFFQVLLKGFRMGYTIACLVRFYHIKGFLLALFSLLPQNIILIPVLCFFTVYQIKFLSARKQLSKGSSLMRRQLYKKNFWYLLLFVLSLSFCSAIEGYLVPILLKPICNLFR